MKIKNIYFIYGLGCTFFNPAYAKYPILTILSKLVESVCDNNCKL